MDDVDEMKLELEVGPTDRMMRNEMSDFQRTGECGRSDNRRRMITATVWLASDPWT